MGGIASGFSGSLFPFSFCLFLVLMFYHSFFLFTPKVKKIHLIHEKRKMNFLPFSLHSRPSVSALLFRTSRAPRFWPAVLGAEIRPGASGRSPSHLQGQLLPAQPPLSPGLGSWGGKARRAGCRCPAQNIAQAPPRSQAGDPGRGGAGARKHCFQKVDQARAQRAQTLTVFDNDRNRAVRP